MYISASKTFKIGTTRSSEREESLLRFCLDLQQRFFLYHTLMLVIRLYVIILTK